MNIEGYVWVEGKINLPNPRKKHPDEPGFRKDRTTTLVPFICWHNTSYNYSSIIGN